MKIFNISQRKRVATALMVMTGCSLLSAASFHTNTAEIVRVNPKVSDTAVTGSTDSSAIKPKRSVSLLSEKSENRLVLLGMSSSDADHDNRILLLTAMLRSGDLEKMTHWYLPMQPYGISLLKQYITTGDTFSKIAMLGIYNENMEPMDSLLSELRRLYLKNPESVNKWVIKTCYPTLNDSERGYSLALKKYFDKPEIPFSIRYQVEGLLANAMYSYYRILDDMDDENSDVDYNMGYLDANFDYYETFKAFSNAFDSLKSQFKAWLPPAEFVEVEELLGLYKNSIKTNQRKNDGLFYYIDTRNQMEKEIVGLLNASKSNRIMLLAPTEELVLNDKKVGFESIVKGLLAKGVPKNWITRIFTFSGSGETHISLTGLKDSAEFAKMNSELLSGSVENDEEEGYFADYFLFGLKSKISQDTTYKAFMGMMFRESKKYLSEEYELTNSHVSIKANDADQSGISTLALMPSNSFSVLMNMAEADNFDEDSEYAWDTAAAYPGYGQDPWVSNYQREDVPKLRHSSAQIEIAYSFMVNQMAQRFASNFSTLLSENNLGQASGSLGYRGIALNLLSSGEKNNAKTYQFWGMRVGEYQTSNKFLSGFHFGYLQGTAFSMDKKRRIYLNLLSYLEGFDTKLTLPNGALVGSLTNPIAGKTFKAVGTVYGMMLGTTLRLNRLFVHANVGYGWDLSSGDWFLDKAAVKGIAPLKYTGVNYGIQAGYKFGLLKQARSDRYDYAAADSVAVYNGLRTIRSNTKGYRLPHFSEKSWVTATEKAVNLSKMTSKNDDDTSAIMAIEGFAPTGYHYDFDDSEISSAAVKLLANRAKKARLVLAGENHRYVKFNSRSEFRWMKLLYENAGYRNYVLELSPARAVFLERYICHGDTLAKKIIQATASARFMVLFDSLAVWQLSLPESERIKIYGLDVERFADMTVMWLNDVATRRTQMLTGTKLGAVPTSIEAGVRAINHLGSNFYYNGLRDYDESKREFEYEQVRSSTDTVSFSLGKKETPAALEIEQLDDWRRLDFSRITFNEDPSVSELYRYIDSLQSDFKNWLGPLWPEFSQAFARLREVYEWEGRDEQAQQYQWREEMMYRNMVTLLEKYPNSKFFGQFGRCHVGLSKQQQDCGWFEYNSILARLRNRYFKNDTSLMNIGIFYKENQDDVDDISSSDLLHNQKIQDEVNALYEFTEDNTMVYNLDESNATINSELRKKFNFVVIVGKEQEDNDDISESYEEESEDDKSVNMGVFMGYGYGANMGSMIGETMQDYLTVTENLSLSNSNVNVYNSLFLGYRAKHVSMQYSLGYKLNSRSLYNDQQVSLDGQLVTHGVSMYLHNSNVYNKKSLHYGLGLGYTFAKQTLTYQKVESTLGLVTAPVDLVNYRGMPTASVVLGILKNNVGLDLEAGYRFQNNTSNWEYKGSRLPFATTGFVDGVSGDLLRLPFATINLRVILPNTQPVYKAKEKDSDSEEDDD